MNISANAFKKIKELKERQGMPETSGVRLEVGASGISLRWAPGPRSTDMILGKPGLPIFIEARAYVRLADYELDVAGVNGSQRFMLKHRRVGKENRRNPS